MRIRSIKPDFCSDEKIGALSTAARLHFILLWMCCDRNGVFENKPRQLAVQLYPYDDKMTAADFEALTSELLQQDLCSTAVVLQKNFCRVNNFNKHQMLTTWEKGNSKPLFTAKELRKHFGSTAEVLHSEERREEECNEKSPPLSPEGEVERGNVDCPERLRPAFEALKSTGKMPGLTPAIVQSVTGTEPDFKFDQNFQEIVEELKGITGAAGNPKQWLLGAIRRQMLDKKNKAAAVDNRGSELLGGECC